MKTIRNIELKFMAAIIIVMAGCQDSPKVIQATAVSQHSMQTGVFETSVKRTETHKSNEAHPSVWHRVEVLQTLPASRYVYLYVIEGQEKHWLATSKMNVVVGDKFRYKSGLLKTNFESKEHGRVFDRIYLVSELIPEKKGLPKSGSSGPYKVEAKGSITVAELIKNKEKYAGKTVRVSGVCTKINPNIMGRNWIHIKDGSRDDYDLVVTSQAVIPKGHPVTMQAIVSLNKDFGSGYSYEILLEEGHLVK